MRIIKGILKVIAAGIVACAVLSALLCFYSITPVHIENPNGNTDYIWPANSVWVKATEGISYGKYDAAGFNNVDVIDDPDIIILGSSHMEATNIMQKDTVASLLNIKFGGEFTAYNMGISGHDFYKVCQYLPQNMELFDKTPKAVVIETSTINLDIGNAEKALNGQIQKTPSNSNGIIAFLQKVPAFRVLYQQIDGGLMDVFMPKNDASTNSVGEEPVAESVDNNAYELIFDYLSSIEREYSSQMIIFYHPTGTLNADGSLSFDNEPYLTAFSESAEKYGITFIDLTDDFIDMYNKNHVVPHGFVTGRLEEGHLNRFGHDAAANRIYEAVKRLKSEGEICS